MEVYILVNEHYGGGKVFVFNSAPPQESYVDNEEPCDSEIITRELQEIIEPGENLYVVVSDEPFGGGDEVIDVFLTEDEALSYIEEMSESGEVRCRIIYRFLLDPHGVWVSPEDDDESIIDEIFTGESEEEIPDENVTLVGEEEESPVEEDYPDNIPSVEEEEEILDENVGEEEESPVEEDYPDNIPSEEEEEEIHDENEEEESPVEEDYPDNIPSDEEEPSQHTTRSIHDLSLADVMGILNKN